MFGDQSWISGTVSTLRSLAVAAGFSVALVGAAEATTFGPGFDLFSTTPGSFVDLTLPTGGVVGVVPLEGNPITGLGNTDTIVERLNEEVEAAGGKLFVMLLPVIFNPRDVETIAGGTFEYRFETPAGPVTMRSAEPRER